MNHFIKYIKIILVSLFVIALSINMVHAYTDNNKAYIEQLKQLKELKCTPKYLENRDHDVSSFLCENKIGEDSIIYRIFFYQIEDYNRDSWSDLGKYATDAKKHLKKYYADKSKINLSSIDGKGVDALIALINQKEVTVKIADIPNAIVDESVITVIGTVYLTNVDIGLELVKKGFAWASPPQWDKNLEYDQAQNIAKENSLGYWSEFNVVSPWDMEAVYTEYKGKADAEYAARYKKERISSLITSWFFFILIPLGFIAVIYAIYNTRSFILVFVLFIPYVAIGANGFLLATHVYNPNAGYAIYGFFFTVPIAVISIFLGFIFSVIASFMNK